MNIKLTTNEDLTITTKGGYTLTAPDATGTIALTSLIPSNVESTTNKVTSISSNSTDTLYPSALAVYTAISNASIGGGGGGSDAGDCPDLSLGTTSGNGNAVTDISVSGHEITMTKGSTFLTSGTTLDSISDGSTRKLANYLPLSGGTMTGAITLPVSSSATDTTKGINFANGNSIIGHVGSSTLLGIYSTGKIVLRPNNAQSGATGNGSLEIDAAGITAYEKITAEGFAKSGGTSSLFLKADGSVDSNTYLTSETSLSKGTTSGSGNAVTDISVSGHLITLTKGSTFLTSETSLSKGSDSGTGNAVTDISVSGHTITLTKGANFATLDSNGLVSANQLPSYVDDVIDGYMYGDNFYRPLVNGELKPDATSSDFTNDNKVTPVKNKIYFWVDDGHCYRWSGTAYVLIIASPGTTDSITEGSTNLYFTDARALAALASSLSGKADKAIPTAANNVALLDATGNLIDSGKTLGKSVPSNAVFTDTDTKVTAAQYHYTPETDNASSVDLVPSGVLKILTAINMDSKGHITSVTSGDLTKTMIGLSSVTNDKLVKGLASGTTSGHVVTFGSDGYTIADSGYTIGKSVPSDAVFTDTWTAASTSAAGYVPAATSGKYLHSNSSTGALEWVDAEAYSVTAIGDAVTFSGTYPNGTYTINTSGIYTTLNTAWTAKKIPVITANLANHTSSCAIILSKDTSDIFIGSAIGKNGNYLIKASISSSSATLVCTSFIDAHLSISGKENTSNKVTSISSSSTNTQYPSALAVYNAIQNATSGSDSGGEGPLIISGVYITDGIVAAGTYASITSAITDGRDVILKVINDDADDEIRYYRLLIDYTATDNLYIFGCVVGLYCYLATISSNNALSFSSASLGGSGLPSVTSSDNGKILLVVNGTWTLVTPSTLYSGSGTPSNSLGNNGDIYILTS